MPTIIMMSCPQFYNFIVNSSTSLKWRNPAPTDYFMDKYFIPSNNNNSLSSSVDIPSIEAMEKVQLETSETPINVSNDEEVVPAPNIHPQEGGKSPPDPQILEEGEKHMVIHDLIKEWVAQWCEVFSYYAPPIGTKRETTQMDEVRRSHVYDDLWEEMYNTAPPPPPGNGPPAKGSNPYNYIVNNEFRVVPTFLLSPQTSLGWEWYLLKDTADLPRSFDPPKD